MGKVGEAESKPETKVNPLRIQSMKGRVDAIANLSLVPCAICFIAFSRPVIYRFFGKGGVFKGFGNQHHVIEANCTTNVKWISNGAFEATCDHKPLDFHALSAIGWLVLFTVQVLMIKFNLRTFHKIIGKFGFGLALINIVGMFQLSIFDMIEPIENTARPPTFTPFMWAIGFEVFYCTKKAWDALKEHKVDEHALWIYRAFIKTFSTPLIRFYPLVLRYIFGTDCMRLNRERFVIGAMTVAAVVCTWFYWKANQYVCKEPMDGFMKASLIKLGITLCVEVYSAATVGLFIVGMAKCAMVGPEQYALQGEL